MAGILRLAAWVPLWLVVVASGQAGGESYDPAPLIRDLQKPETHAAAVKTLSGLPVAAMVPLLEAADAIDTPTDTRDEIYTLLKPVFARLRAARAAADDALGEKWVKTYLVDAYESAGRKDEKWNGPAEEGLAAPYGVKQFEFLTTAVETGCADPLVRLEYVSDGLINGRIDVTQVSKHFLPAYQDLQKADYPPATKALVTLKMAVLMGSIEWPADYTVSVKFANVFNAALEWLPAYVSSKPDPRELQALVAGMYNSAVKLSPDRGAAYDRVFRVVDGVAPDSGWADAIAARHFEQFAWDERGGDTIDQVTPKGMQLFMDLIEESKTRALKAWREDPLNVYSALVMMDDFRSGAADDEGEQAWFRRALLAEPGNYSAWNSRAFYYSPQWYGSVEQAIAVGREAVEKGTGRDQVPRVLLEVFANIDRLSGADGEIFRHEDTWQLVKSVYEKLLADKSRLVDDRPRYLADRSDYLFSALHAHHWQAFLDLHKTFGDEIDLKRAGGKDRMAYELRHATDMLTRAATQPAEK